MKLYISGQTISTVVLIKFAFYKKLFLGKMSYTNSNGLVTRQTIKLD